eukprot:GHVP01057219.1.p1 GENE.GHVP01057219.1~~GHVP01057219.1.p1  ORF type:complete len:110 (-),score=9.74 GHVP01057219.1:148-477(-)
MLIFLFLISVEGGVRFQDLKRSFFRTWPEGISKKFSTPIFPSTSMFSILPILIFLLLSSRRLNSSLFLQYIVRFLRTLSGGTSKKLSTFTPYDHASISSILPSYWLLSL